MSAAARAFAAYTAVLEAGGSRIDGLGAAAHVLGTSEVREALDVLLDAGHLELVVVDPHMVVRGAATQAPKKGRR